MMRTGFIICLIAFCACKQRINTAREILLDQVPGQCPYLTKDDKGNTVISWVRMNGDSTSSFCYAIAESDET